MDNLIKKYISYPLAITIFKQDLEKFNQFKLGNLYQDMLESIIERMTKDYFELKAELIKVHHLDVEKVEVGKYEINKEIVEFTSEELKSFTEQVMSDYLYGDSARGFERTNRTWED